MAYLRGCRDSLACKAEPISVKCPLTKLLSHWSHRHSATSNKQRLINTVVMGHRNGVNIGCNCQQKWLKLHVCNSRLVFENGWQPASFYAISPPPYLPCFISLCIYTSISHSLHCNNSFMKHIQKNYLICFTVSLSTRPRWMWFHMFEDLKLHQGHFIVTYWIRCENYIWCYYYR